MESLGIAKQIAAAGYAVYAMDYPGFGLSEGLHGFISSFDQLADDVIEQYTKIKGLALVLTLSLFVIIGSSLLRLTNCFLNCDRQQNQS